MKALTLWRPWPWAIFHWPAPNAKALENRDWEPPQWLVGQRFAIHAGKKFDQEAAEELLLDIDLTERLPSEAGKPFPAMLEEGVIGTAMLSRIYRTEGEVPAAQRRWWVGSRGWGLAAVRPLKRPIPCRGAQGLWDLPRDVETRVLAEFGR